MDRFFVNRLKVTYVVDVLPNDKMRTMCIMLVLNNEFFQIMKRHAVIKDGNANKFC